MGTAGRIDVSPLPCAVGHEPEK